MEWTKVRTDPGTPWWALALILTTVAVGALTVATTDPLDCMPRPCTLDGTRLSLTGVYVGQIAAVVFAARIFADEYSAANIRQTLMACPRRGVVFAAKAGIVTITVAATAFVALGATYLTARGIPAGEATRRAYLGSVLYLCLVALLGLAVGAIVRHGGAAIATALSLLYVTPIASLFVTDPLWQARIRRYSPMTAGLAIQDTVAHGAQPIGPWAGLGVLAAYTGAALVVGVVLFYRRDA